MEHVEDYGVAPNNSYAVMKLTRVYGHDIEGYGVTTYIYYAVAPQLDKTKDDVSLATA